MRDQHEHLPLTGKEGDTNRSEKYIKTRVVCTVATEFARESTRQRELLDFFIEYAKVVDLRPLHRKHDAKLW